MLKQAGKAQKSKMSREHSYFVYKQNRAVLLRSLQSILAAIFLLFSKGPKLHSLVLLGGSTPKSQTRLPRHNLSIFAPTSSRFFVAEQPLLTNLPPIHCAVFSLYLKTPRHHSLAGLLDHKQVCRSRMAQRTTRSTASGTSASRTITVTNTPNPSELPMRLRSSGRLQLRAEAGPSQRQEPERRIQWAADVVDNEGMGKKSSKVCCIYHKPREAGESSDEESSDSSSSDESEDNANDGAARPTKRRRSDEHCRDPEHSHAHNGQHATTNAGKGKRQKARKCV